MPAMYPGNAITKAARAASGGGFESAIDAPVSSTGWRANEPSDLTAWHPLNFDDTVSNTTGWAGYGVDNLSYVVDAESPSPGSNVGRILYPAGKAGGSSTINIGIEGTSVQKKRIYTCIGVKMSPNFQYHLTGTNKIFFISVPGYGGSGDPYFFNIDADTDPAKAGAVLQGALPRVFTMPSSAEMVKDQWYTIEMLLTMNTPGIADGKYEQWVNGVKTNDHSDVEYVNDIYYFGNPTFQNTWGGSGDTVVEDFYPYCSEFFVSWSDSV